MTSAPSAATVNSFIGGLKTEFTALNFPENSCTDTQNCVFTIVGDVLRREGIDYEANGITTTINRSGQAISSYKWNNVGGDGQTQIVVEQVGGALFFYSVTNSTISSPLSTQMLSTNITLSSFVANGGSVNNALECQFADGNGFLFVYHPNCDPFYCTFDASTGHILATKITVQIRDFIGINPEPGNPLFNNRPGGLSSEHLYNLENQGWTSGSTWGASSSTSNVSISGSSIVFNAGVYTWAIGNVAGIAVGQQVTLSVSGSFNYTNGGVNYSGGGFSSGGSTISGSVTGYSGGNITINVGISPGILGSAPGTSSPAITGITAVNWSIGESNVVNTINTFFNGVGVYPSNADIWFSFKNTSDVFSPSTTVGNVSLPASPSPRGHFIIPAFSQNRASMSGIGGLSTVSTLVRPRTGTWFQGRVWYSGVDASQLATGDQGYYTWTENIYFSQIITSPTEFGFCYQENDPTDENLFDVLPTDGGVITIQGTGAIYRLFPIQNGLLVFAANGIWFITGSQGIGFSASDYTVTKVSGVQITSATSFVNVLGYPFFWNEEGIYGVSPGSSGSIQVENIAIGTILSFYNNIPLQSKKYARGDFDYVNHQIQWCYRSTNESSVTDRYQYDRILILNIVNKAFYYYTLPAGTPYIHDIRYVAGPGGSTSPSPVFKYLTSASNGAGSYNFTWAEERDTNYIDWHSFDGVGKNYVSYFITAFYMSPRKHPFYGMYGQSFKKFSLGYIYVFLRNTINNSYKIQGQWDFAVSGNSGKWSTVQTITDNTNTNNFGMIYHRHKIRGHGLSMQIKISSVDGKPFDIMGWSTNEYFSSVP